ARFSADEGAGHALSPGPSRRGGHQRRLGRRPQHRLRASRESLARPEGTPCLVAQEVGPMTSSLRPDGRKPDELRPLTFRRRYTRQAPGSVLVRQGRTLVLCTCTVEEAVPPFLLGTGKGWLTAEYGMLPGSTNTRKQRDRGGKVDGRSVEIQRLIGRSLRAVV